MSGIDRRRRDAGCFATASDDDSYGNAVMHRLVVGMFEVLQETNARFQRRGSVAQRPLDVVPQRQMRVNDRHHEDTHQALANGGALSQPGGEAKVEDGGEGSFRAAKLMRN